MIYRPFFGKMQIKSQTRLTGLTCLTLILFSCATAPKSVERPVFQEQGFVVHEKQLPSFPLVMNEEVEKWISYFQNQGRERFELYLQRSGKYSGMIRKTLRQHGVPEDLVYLAMIESGFNPHAYSRARATGKWQFMYRTGLRYGLKVNSWVDERRDPERSTVAAARHLKDLYEEFGDWYLAIAAYNAGAGKIQRAVRRYGTRDFWELSQGGRRYLRPETRNYVPKMLAAAFISKDPRRYGFGHVHYERPLQYDKVAVDTPTDLRIAAECAGVTYSEMKELNPELRHWVTPPNESSYSLRLPIGTTTLFQNCFQALAPAERIAETIYTVQQGGTIRTVARKFGFSADYLAVLNQTSPTKQLARGDQVLIPYAPPQGEKYRHAVFYEEPVIQGDRVAYRVRRGDSLWKISRRLGVKMSRLRGLNPHINWEGLRYGRTIKIVLRAESTGPELVQAVAPAEGSMVVHKILAGETLWEISQRYKVKVHEIKQWNGISNHRRLRPGQSLKIYVASNTPNEV